MSIPNIMIAKKKFYIAACMVLLSVVIALNIWSVHIKGDVIGYSYLLEDGETVYFSCGCTVVNTSIFPQNVTVEVYSYRDAATSYITNSELKVESVNDMSMSASGENVGEVTEGDSFEVEPLSSRFVEIICTSEYGGTGFAER